MKVQYSNIQQTFGAKLTIFPQPFNRRHESQLNRGQNCRGERFVCLL